MTTINAYHTQLEGSNYQIGRQLGLMVQKNPELAAAHLLPVAAFAPEEERKVLAMFASYCPGLNEEIAGFCDVMKIPVGRVLYYALSYLKPGCSQMAVLASRTVDGHIRLARNYDFSEKMEELTLCTTKVTGKYAHLGATAVLFGREDGLNERGLAVSMTSAGLPVSNMEGAIKKPGVVGLMFWSVIRAVLENCADVAEVIRFTREMPIAFNINLMVADPQNNAALIETYDGQYAVKRIDGNTPEQFLCSTNHVCLPELAHLEDGKMKNSVIRFNLIEQLLSKKTQVTKEDLKNLLATQYPAGLGMDFYDEFLGTLRSMIVDVTEGEIDLCFGSPDLNPWYRYRVADPIEHSVIPVQLRKKIMGDALWEMV